MQKFPFLAAAALLIAGSAWAAEPKAQEGLACFENLQAPEYPTTALQDHIDGSVWTYVHANSQGLPEKIDTQVVSAWSAGNKLFVPPVEKAVRAAKIKPECAGKTISVVFRFELHGNAVPNPKVTSRTDGPTLMWIESEPAGAAVKH
jgi:hypothetical protein